MNEKMLAIQINSFGGPEVLKIEYIPIPKVGPKDILLKISACGIDRKDLLIRNGTIRKKSSGYRSSASQIRSEIDFPLVLGAEIAGVIAEIGSEIRGFKVGDRVASLPRRGHCGQCIYCHTGRSESCTQSWFIGQDSDGGYAEYTLVGADSLCLVPEKVDLIHASLSAACIGTMIRAIRDVGAVQIGESVLITGASGGLGAHGIELAKLSGAFVIAIASSEMKADFMRSLGADEVIVANRGEDWSSKVLYLTNGRGVDVGIDIVGASNFKYVLKSMALYGRIACVGEIEGGSVDFMPAIILLKRLKILGSYAPGIEHMSKALELLEKKNIHPIIDSILALSKASEAHLRMETKSDIKGRIVLCP